MHVAPSSHDVVRPENNLTSKHLFQREAQQAAISRIGRSCRVHGAHTYLYILHRVLDVAADNSSSVITRSVELVCSKITPTENYNTTSHTNNTIELASSYVIILPFKHWHVVFEVHV